MSASQVFLPLGQMLLKVANHSKCSVFIFFLSVYMFREIFFLEKMVRARPSFISEPFWEQACLKFERNIRMAATGLAKMTFRRFFGERKNKQNMVLHEFMLNRGEGAVCVRIKFGEAAIARPSCAGRQESEGPHKTHLTQSGTPIPSVRICLT